jgi:hypothetical protein
LSVSSSPQFGDGATEFGSFWWKNEIRLPPSWCARIRSPAPREDPASDNRCRAGQDPFERGAVVDPRATTRAATRRPLRDQRLDQFPAPVRDQLLLLASRHDRGRSDQPLKIV